MRKTVQKIFAAVFVLFLLVPVGGMLFVGESAAGANEISAPKPVLINDGKLNIAYLNELTDYFADRFAFRQEMITLWAEINSKLLKTSTEEQVVLGSEGRLYYSETLDDYRGVSLDEKYLDIIVNNLALMQEFVESEGGTFVFTVAPNKNSLYPDYMPARIENRHEYSNICLISEELNSRINYADLFALFNSLDGCYYYLTDTHWTDEGAAIGADLILQKAGVESHFAADTFINEGVHTGDLYEMLYPVLGDNEIKLAASSGFTYNLLNDDKAGNALKIKTENINQSGNLFCWRDSFGISLYPYLAEKFGQAVFMRSPEYNLFSCNDFSDTTVIIELVERNLDYLITNAPRFASPERNAFDYRVLDYSLAAKAEGSESFNGSDYGRYSVSVVSENNEKDNRVYFVSGEMFYEAYLNVDFESGDIIACAWIDTDAVPDGVVYMLNGEYVYASVVFE